MIVYGVDITSRYDVSKELELMQRVIEAVPEIVRDQIKSMDCDSNCQACYSVVLRRWNSGEAEAIAKYVDSALVIFDGGYNVLFLRHGEDKLQFGAEWPLDFLAVEGIETCEH
jgi:hypothetical protein